ncbi:hypothetical protein EKO04_009749 [Ascochyta lentis]|uniref:Uncharacterized protein n=1 Tax=Ascochyta lentis TaxID=205686 RepID=A0A8H7IUF5_9PLEO|nr:hypothetical protein EKO04_009749 [Ascochyta lentis]
MSTDTIKTVNACKATWAAAIERTELARNEKKRLALGVRWGHDGAEKGIEIRLSFIRSWPFLRTSMLVGAVAPRPPVWDSLPDVDIEEVEQVEMDKEREEHWVAPGESRKSFDGVVGGDCPHVWRRC